MVSPTEYTRKVQGTRLTCTRGVNPAFDIGEIIDFNGLGSPKNDIPIGSWADTVRKTRGGRKNTSEARFDLFLNPDKSAQRQLIEMEGTDEEAVYRLIYSEGTVKTRTFTAMVSLFHDSASDNGVYMGHITLAVLTGAEKS